LDKTQKEIAMKKLMLGTITALFALSMGSPAFAQQHMPRGTATDVTNDEIQATVAKTPDAKVSDQQIRVVNVAGEYNVGVGVVHRSKTEGPQTANGIERDVCHWRHH
jgi:hypothetical protein